MRRTCGLFRGVASPGAVNCVKERRRERSVQSHRTMSHYSQNHQNAPKRYSPGWVLPLPPSLRAQLVALAAPRCPRHPPLVVADAHELVCRPTDYYDTRLVLMWDSSRRTGLSCLGCSQDIVSGFSGYDTKVSCRRGILFHSHQFHTLHESPDFGYELSLCDLAKI